MASSRWVADVVYALKSIATQLHLHHACIASMRTHITTGPTVAQQLARFVTKAFTGDLPSRHIELAKMVVASTLASAARGYRIGCIESFRTLALESGGTPDATLWFNGTKVPAPVAAGVNNASSDAPGMDDTCLLLIGHFGGPSTAAALAMWEHLARQAVPVPASQVLKAIVLGYEVGSRFDLALTPGRMDRGFHSRVTTVQSAAVAAGLVLGLTEEQMVHAIALATSDAGGMAIGADQASDHRPYHAHQSAFEGSRLARLAQLGLTGRPDIIEAPRGYFSAFGGQDIFDITKDLGERWNFVDYMAVKLMPGAHPFHVFAEAATAAALENDIDVDAVARVIISGEQLTGVQMKDWIDIRHPTNLSDAAHSIVYFVAAAVANAKSGGFTWEHMNAVKMADPRIARLQDLVEVDSNPLPLTNARFVHLDGGRVSIVTKSGESFTKHVQFPSGSALVVQWPAVREKFRRLVRNAGMPEEQMEEILRRVERFEGLASPSKLTELLQLPTTEGDDASGATEVAT
jgi:2-methylcitrate dehydratase PrpD